MSKNYDVYLEIFGKKMKVTMLAESESQAKEMVKNKIIFHKINVKKDTFNNIVDTLNGFDSFINGLKKK